MAIDMPPTMRTFCECVVPLACNLCEFCLQEIWICAGVQVASMKKVCVSEAVHGRHVEL